MPLGESPAGAAVEVSLEVPRQVLRFESEIALELPRREFRGVGRAAFVVLLEAGSEIGGEADVGFVGVSDASQEIDVVH